MHGLALTAIQADQYIISSPSRFIKLAELFKRGRGTGAGIRDQVGQG
jgi:hypothetical protein